jgi:hypothetical protein
MVGNLGGMGPLATLDVFNEGQRSINPAPCHSDAALAAPGRARAHGAWN